MTACVVSNQRTTTGGSLGSELHNIMINSLRFGSLSWGSPSEEADRNDLCWT